MDGAALLVAAGLVGRFAPLPISYSVVAFTVLLLSGMQRSRINPRLGDDAAFLLGALAAPFLVLVPFAASDTDLGGFMRGGPAVVGLLLFGRAIAYKLIRVSRSRGLVVEPTLIVGAGQLGVQVARTLQEHPEFGLRPMGFLESFDDRDLPLPVLGDVHELEAVARETGLRTVIVAFGATREPEMVRILRACDRLPIEVYVLPRFFELGVGPEGRFTDDLWGIPLVRLRRSALRTVAWRVKRAFDLVVGSILLVASAPILLVAAVAVRLSSPGPALFRQRRIGQRGEVFEVFKFRTLPVNEDSDTQWTVGGDERMTAVGRVLRRSGLDELPQLVNVIRGQMSLVGPRPERPHFVDRFGVAIRGYHDRHRVPVGITGWAQVHGLRGDTSIPERALFDNHYIEHWSLWRDVVILVRTIGTVLSHGDD
jgi:exopolysaccharide biosynthesis polyprenyl glycosylphosphotransferase